MSAAYREFARTDQHGVTSREQHRLTQDIDDWLQDLREQGRTIKQITANVTAITTSPRKEA